MAVPTVSITGNILSPSGEAPTSGRVTARLSAPGSALDGLATVRVGAEVSANLTTGGAVSLALVPNDNIVPSGTYYLVTIILVLANGRRMQWAERWSVPYTPTPIDVGSVPRLSSSPTQYYTTEAAVAASVVADAAASAAAALASEVAAEAAQTAAEVAASSFPINVKQFGAVGNGVANDTSAIQAALDAAHAQGGGTVFIPPGTYMVTPVGTTTWLKMYSGTTLQGAGRASVLKVTSGAQYQRVIGAGPTAADSITDAAVTELCIDQNTVNAAAVGMAAGQYQIAIEWLYGSQLTVDRVAFDTCAGVNTVVIQNASKVQITNNRIRFVAKTSPPDYDNTAIYLSSTDVVVSGNVLESTIADGGYGGVELHVGRAVFTGNRSVGYDNLVRVITPASGPEIDSTDVSIVGNSASEAGHAIDLWPCTGYTMRGVVVSGNALQINNADRLASGLLGFMKASHYGIAFYDGAGVAGDYDGVIISGNTITCQQDTLNKPTGDSSSGGIVATIPGSMRNVLIESNVIVNSPHHGIRLYPAGTATNVHIRDNVIVNAGHCTASVYRMAIGIFGIIKCVRVERNHVSDLGVSMLGSYGLFIQPSATSADNIVGSNRFWTASGSTYAHILDQTYSAEAKTRVVTTSGAVAIEANEQQTLETRHSNADSWTLLTPTGAVVGARLSVRVVNVSGGAMGTITWGAGFRLGTWTNPANGYSRSIVFEFNGTNWVESSRTPSDVPN